MTDNNVETEIVQSQYGDVEIEVVDCDSCGNRVAKEDTVPFSIGSREGLACKHCEQEGPVSFPQKVREWTLPSEQKNGETFGLGFYIGLFPLTFPITFLDGLKGYDDFAEGYATAVITLAVLGLLIYGVVFVL